MDYHDNEYRQQCSRERIAWIREEYRRAQAAPSDSRPEREAIAWISSIWQRARRQAAQHSPAYKA